jgi:transposase
MSKTIIGIDISKDHLDVHRLPDGARRHYRNNRTGHRALLKWLRGDDGSGGGRPDLVVYEPTGAYHRDLELALGTAGLPLAKVNPRHARRFAEATGQLAKTDRLDAEILARFGAAIEPSPRCQPSPLLGQLAELRRAHQALVKDRTAAKNRAKQLRHDLLKRQNQDRLRRINDDLKAIETAMQTLIDQDEALRERFAILLSIPGIARLSAFAMLIDMPELGEIGAKQAAALAGLAPITRQSGAWKGRAAIRGGRAALRQALYMPALVATRFNPDLEAKYKDLVKVGKPAKVAITAVMRKLLILANTLLRERRKWQNLTA